MKRFVVICAIILFAAGSSIADNYGVLFSGGINAANNHNRYYEETLRMYNIMTGTLGYDEVYVLFGDGTDTADDLRVWDSSTTWHFESSDWSMIPTGYIEAGTYTNLQNRLTSLQTTIGPDDCFHFWSFDHGYNETYDDSPPVPATFDLGGLCAWDPTWTNWMIPDEDFASWVNPISAYAESYAFGQCFAGDMVDELNILPGENRFAAWAADWDEPSWGRAWVDVWADALEGGLVWTHDIGEYARLNDPAAEHPGWVGDNFHIITNEPIPAPAALLLGFLGLGTAGMKLRKFS